MTLQSNHSFVLAIIANEGAISRSRLTTATGLNRSTVARIIQQLVDLRLVIETNPESSGRVGRPSPVVRLEAAPAMPTAPAQRDISRPGAPEYSVRDVRMFSEIIRTNVQCRAIAEISSMLADPDRDDDDEVERELRALAEELLAGGRLAEGLSSDAFVTAAVALGRGLRMTPSSPPALEIEDTIRRTLAGLMRPASRPDRP